MQLCEMVLHFQKIALLVQDTRALLASIICKSWYLGILELTNDIRAITKVL